MEPLKHIVFPYDFSRQATQAVPFVRAIASKFGAKVTIVGVVPPVWNTVSADLPVLVDEELAEKERDLQSRLERAFAGEFPGIATGRVTTTGDPALRIVDYAHSQGADLIMMPTHGFGIFRSMLLGSVTAKVLHDAKCPVWTATHAEEQRSPAEPRTILCAVNGDPQQAVSLMQWAAAFSKKAGSALKLLHVVPPISDWLAIPSERELQEQVRNEGRVQMESLRASAGVDAPLTIAVGKITDTVTEEARQSGADLIVIGRGSVQSTLGRLRTHVYGIVQQSPCPVLSV
jgi:nucleotide-binding universal stress UspA family protein